MSSVAFHFGSKTIMLCIRNPLKQPNFHYSIYLDSGAPDAYGGIYLVYKLFLFHVCSIAVYGNTEWLHCGFQTQSFLTLYIQLLDLMNLLLDHFKYGDGTVERLNYSSLIYNEIEPTTKGNQTNPNDVLSNTSVCCFQSVYRRKILLDL